MLRASIILTPEIDGFPTVKQNGSYAPKCHMSPNLLITVDRSVFKQTKEQKGALLTAKEAHKAELRRYYGSNWKRHLNTPERSLGAPIRHSF